MDIGCHPCGIFEGLSHPQEVESITLANFATSEGLAKIINNPAL